MSVNIKSPLANKSVRSLTVPAELPRAHLKGVGSGGDVDIVEELEAAGLVWEQQLPLSKDQTHVLVERFAASRDWNKHNWSAAQFRAALDASPEAVTSSPLLLCMALCILPSMTSGVFTSAKDDKVN